MTAPVIAAQDGPSIRLDMSCFGCKFVRSKSYAVQGDSGHRVTCSAVDGKYIGDSNWSTPEWCPKRAAALDKFYQKGCKA